MREARRGRVLDPLTLTRGGQDASGVAISHLDGRIEWSAGDREAPPHRLAEARATFEADERHAVKIVRSDLAAAGLACRANCEANGKPAVQYVPGENSIDVRNQMKQGRIDAAVQGSETLPYAMANEAGKYRIVGAPFTLGYQGIAFRKTDVALRAAVMEAMKALIGDGGYKAILDKHGLGANAVAEPLVNASPL